MTVAGVTGRPNPGAPRGYPEARAAPPLGLHASR